MAETTRIEKILEVRAVLNTASLDGRHERLQLLQYVLLLYATHWSCEWIRWIVVE